MVGQWVSLEFSRAWMEALPGFRNGSSASSELRLGGFRFWVEQRLWVEQRFSAAWKAAFRRGFSR
jgi:hypothetical protein